MKHRVKLSTSSFMSEKEKPEHPIVDRVLPVEVVVTDPQELRFFC
jgi:hypothetical protein